MSKFDIILIDTVNITSTVKAALDGDDAVHFRYNTTRLEAEETTRVLKKFNCL